MLRCVMFAAVMSCEALVLNGVGPRRASVHLLAVEAGRHAKVAKASSGGASFEEAQDVGLTLAREMCARREEGSPLGEGARVTLGELLSTSPGARGWFVSLLTQDEFEPLFEWPLDEALLCAIESTPEVTLRLLAMNVAMPTATGLAHVSNGDVAMAEASQTTARRAGALVEALLDRMPGLRSTMLSLSDAARSTSTSEGGDWSQFLTKWGYDDAQRRAISAAASSLCQTSLCPVLTPSARDQGRWDSACVANPVVLPPLTAAEDGDNSWKMFYYGNDGSWADGSVGFLPTGTTGLAESADGVKWTKVDGPRGDASVFGPSDDVDAWDGLHSGVGDVLRHDDGLLMFYLGGGGGGGALLGGKEYRGVKMQIGRAVSKDGGRTWTRCGSGETGDGPVLEQKDDEGLFCSWPRVVRFDDDAQWLLSYHAFNGTHWRAFTAKSKDEGLTWTDRKLALDTGAADAFDAAGVGTRTLLKRENDLLMVYEGVEKGTGTHRLGAATSTDGGETWHRENGGEPILEPGVAPMGGWTTQVVGTPYLVPHDGGLRLYYCAKAGPKANMSIGLLVSDSGDVTPGAWRAAGGP